MDKYVQMSSTSPGYSYIKVTNNAGYIARFSITYTFKGKARTQKSSEFTLFQSDQIYIPNEAILVALKIEEEAFIGKWVVFHVAIFIKPVTKCYSLSGTIINPKATEIACVGNYSENCEIKKAKTKFTDYIY